jgi:hypothetical protein
MACYYSVQKALLSLLLSKNTEDKNEQIFCQFFVRLCNANLLHCKKSIVNYKNSMWKQRFWENVWIFDELSKRVAGISYKEGLNDLLGLPSNARTVECRLIGYDGLGI